MNTVTTINKICIRVIDVSSTQITQMIVQRLRLYEPNARIAPCLIRITV